VRSRSNFSLSSVEEKLCEPDKTRRHTCEERVSLRLGFGDEPCALRLQGRGVRQCHELSLRNAWWHRCVCLYHGLLHRGAGMLRWLRLSAPFSKARPRSPRRLSLTSAGLIAQARAHAGDKRTNGGRWCVRRAGPARGRRAPPTSGGERPGRRGLILAGTVRQMAIEGWRVFARAIGAGVGSFPCAVGQGSARWREYCQ
jgi:hypothetical protein